jgi:hypothetical protein
MRARRGRRVVLSRRVEATEEALEAACKEIAELGVTDERVVGIDLMGGPAALLEVPTTTRGYERLLRWAEGFGPLGCAGIEGPAASDRNPTHAASLGALRKEFPKLVDRISVRAADANTFLQEWCRE